MKTWGGGGGGHMPPVPPPRSYAYVSGKDDTGKKVGSKTLYIPQTFLH